MNIKIEPCTPKGPVMKPDLRQWLDRLDAPSVLGFRVASVQRLEHEASWHHHARAQLLCVEAGLVTVRTHQGDWSLPPGHAGWIPPAEEHAVMISGPLRGWGLLLAPAACRELYQRPCAIGISELLHALALRVAEWSPDVARDAAQTRLERVLLDEIRQAPIQSLHLPMPLDRRLLRIASQVLSDPGDDRGLEAWASSGGLSARSLSRHFRDQTGLSFGQWRQQARLAESLRLLHANHSIGEIAHRLGFSSASAFVTVFHRHYGAPPARYLQRARWNPAGLASPAASG